MSNAEILTLIGVICAAITGCASAIKIIFSHKNKSRDKTTLKNIIAGGDVVGRDKKVNSNNVKK